LNTAIRNLKLNPNIKIEQPDIVLDLDKVTKEVEAVKTAISKIDVRPEVNIDMQAVISACKETTKAIEEIIFPVPNFQSSWQKSLTMQSEDLGKTYTWTTDGGQDVVETITFTGYDGKQYRKTYGYDGSGKVLTETAWTEV
jgi:septation ring formation regulator EzrA